MTVSPARRQFILRLSAAVSDEQAIELARLAVADGVPMRDIAADLNSWAELRKAEIQYVRTTP